MRVVLQRVSEASVTVDGTCIGEIGTGLLVLLGVGAEDEQSDIDWLVGKCCRLRIFPDAEGKMNCSVVDVTGDFLVVSQFTLFASTRKGNRPAFTAAAPPEQAERMYEQFVTCLRQQSQCQVATGRFAADMKVNLLNDGPVTITIDSRQRE